jgi:uncharacterized membrane protein YraQ (UPF0718 family)
MEQHKVLHFDRLSKPRRSSIFSSRAWKITLTLIFVVVAVGSIAAYIYKDHITDWAKETRAKYGLVEQ